MTGAQSSQASLFAPEPSAEERVADVDIIGGIGAGLFETGVTLEGVRSKLAAAGKVDRVKVVINSGGGSVFEGFAIFAELDMHPAPVSVEIRGIAGSIASVIAMAAEKGQIAIHELGRIMIHQSRAGLFGTSNEHDEMRELLADLDEAIASAYSRHTIWAQDDVSSAMKATTWLKAKDAVKAGFASSIVKGGGEAVNYAGLDALSAFGIRLPDDVRPSPKNQDVDLLDRVTAQLRTHTGALRVPSPAAWEIDSLRSTLRRLKETN